MESNKKKVLVIGVDQAIIGLIEKYIREGAMPNLKELRKRGVFTEAFSCPPCDTPTNWTTISTGATTGVHGCTSFYPHAVGEEFEIGLQNRSRSMLSDFCQADYIWDAADRAGLKCFVINYPSGWPGKLKNGAISTYTWNVPESPKRVIEKGRKRTYSQNNDNNMRNIRIIDTNSDIAQSIGSKLPPLEILVDIKNSTQEITHKFYVVGDSTYDSLCYFEISTETNEKIKHTQNINEWTDFLSTKAHRINKGDNSDYETIEALYKIKLLDVDSEGKKVKIQYSSVYSLDAWVNPPTYAEGLIRNALAEEVNYASDVEYMIEGTIEDFLIEANNECGGIVKALEYMKKTMDWDLAIFHVHFLDSVNHYSLGYLYEQSPLIKINPDYVDVAKKNVKTAYKIIDNMVGELMEKVIDENTVVFFLADHGAIPVWKTVNLTSYFAQMGLTKYHFKDGKYVIDWEKTKAFPYHEPHYVWVNKKGRDPQGIVGDEVYEVVREQIISVLEDLKDPHTGEKIMRAVFKKEDAAFLGQNGPRVGDVVYFLNPPYQLFDGDISQLKAHEVPPYLMNEELVKMSDVCYGAHAYYLPTTKFGICSCSVPLLITGPGIKNNVDLKPPINLIDVAPTISKILNIDVPKNAQGRILHEIFEK